MTHASKWPRHSELTSISRLRIDRNAKTTLYMTSYTTSYNLHLLLAMTPPKAKLLHQLSNASLNAMQLLQQLNPSSMQFLKLFVVLFTNMLIFPRHATMDIFVPKNRFVVIEAVSPLVWHSIDIFDAYKSTQKCQDMRNMIGKIHSAASGAKCATHCSGSSRQHSHDSC